MSDAELAFEQLRLADGRWESLILPAATLARQDVVRVVVLAALFAGVLLLLILGF